MNGGYAMENGTERFERAGSPLFLGVRTARDEQGRIAEQVYIDLPRKEPRKLIDPESWSPPDMKNHDAMKDKAPTTADEAAPPGIIFLRPVLCGETLPFTMTRSSGAFTLNANGRLIEGCFDGPEQIRLRGDGVGLRAYAPLLDHEAVIDRQDGTYQVCIEASCEALFVPLKGSAAMNNPWSRWHGGTEKLLLDIAPDETGKFEIAIHITPSSTEMCASYRPFEECVLEDETLNMNGMQTNSPEISAQASRKQVEAMPIMKTRDTDKPLLGSEYANDLRATEFSRRGSFLCVLENDDDRELYLSISRSPEMWAQRSHLIRIAPVLWGRELPYEYDVTPGRMTIRTCAGTVEMCFDAEHRLHIRGTGVRLRMYFKMMLFENVCPMDNGDWEVAYSVLGKTLFSPIQGGVYCDGHWVPEASRADDFIMEWIPSTETGVFEAVVENDYTTVVRPEHFMGFDDCVRDAERDFDAFRARFPRVAEKYANMAKLAAFIIWTHTVGPSGNLKHEIVYMTRIQWLRAFGWQQSYQAMAASGDIREAWKLLMTMFDYQDKGGQLPDSVGDIGVTYRVTKPALQGLALLFLVERCDTSAISREQWAALYDRMARFATWWLTFRDRSKSGLPQYFHSDESPGEWCTVFEQGLPVFSADLVSFVALLTEACGKLAGWIGDRENERRWTDTSNELIRRMIDTLWDGDRFQTKLVKTGETLESRCVLEILPVMLGNRLPEEILDKLIDHMQNDQGKDAFVPSARSLFYNVLICAGLESAGRGELARHIARLSADEIAKNGFSMMGGGEKDRNEPNGMTRKKEPSKTGKWTSWYAACYIILAGLLPEDQP